MELVVFVGLQASGKSGFTCHRGRPLPEKPSLPRPAVPAVPPSPLSAADAARPATEIYSSIQALSNVAAGDVVRLMSWFTEQLGVSCAHCHSDGGRWASDDRRAKLRARQMLLMVGSLARLYYQGSTPVTCGTCHRGETRPARTPADLAAGRG